MMISRTLVAGVLVTGALIPGSVSHPRGTLTTSAGPATTGVVSVTMLPRALDASLGEHFVVRARVTNMGSGATGPLIAHLNVVSLDRSVYVDPEDWSPSRTRELRSLSGGAAVSETWSIQAVSSGHFVVYVVVVPDATRTTQQRPLVASTPTYVVVADRTTLDAGGALEVAIAVPVVVGVVALILRRRRRSTD